MSIKAVIFDLDGTITEPFLDFGALRQQMGLNKDSGPVWEAMEAMSPSQRAHAQKLLHKYELEAITKSTLNPGARRTLQRLRESDIGIAVLTRNTKANAVAVAQKHNLHFDIVVGREDGPVKPDAFGVLEICRQFDVNPNETLLVGDYLFDLLCAKAAGANAVLLANHADAEDFAVHADFTIEKIEQILQIIEQTNQI
ncbi:HAD family hydrolase [Planctomycetota bacterium]